MKFRLLKSDEYAHYQEKMCRFEQAFKYPLGDNLFQIKHGGDKQNYVSFFQSLGQPKVFILEHNAKILGVGCAILRTVKNNKIQKFWYLCDFKLCPSVRGQNYLLKLLIRYILPCYLKSKNLLVINMSAPNGNWLVHKLKGLFCFLKLKTYPIYFYEWSVDEFLYLKTQNPKIFFDKNLCSNFALKDIIINDELQPIVHLVDKKHLSVNLPRHKALSLENLELECSPLIMLATSDIISVKGLREEGIEESYQGTMMSTQSLEVDDLHFSSLEI